MGFECSAFHMTKVPRRAVTDTGFKILFPTSFCCVFLFCILCIVYCILWGCSQMLFRLVVCCSYIDTIECRYGIVWQQVMWPESKLIQVKVVHLFSLCRDENQPKLSEKEKS